MREVNSLFQDIKKEKKKNYKPISRILFHPDTSVATSYHLSGIGISSHLYLPTLRRIADIKSANLDEQSLAPVYVAFQHPRFTRQ